MTVRCAQAPKERNGAHALQHLTFCRPVSGMKTTAAALLTRLRFIITDSGSHRAWALAANDGVIATAGILEGFAGAGADDATLVLAGLAATVAGMFTTGGAKWAEAASEREAQLSAMEEERSEIKRQPRVELSDLTAYYEKKGLSQALALEVAVQLMKRSPLKAQLESEHGILNVISRADVIQASLGAALAYALGAAVPFFITVAVPIRLETWLVVAAVAVSLTFISVVGREQDTWTSHGHLGATW
jgi:VIT1/CCC1 family predicted Fe2+/Mn2+ transporter